jgi:hypothetical protein
LDLLRCDSVSVKFRCEFLHLLSQHIVLTNICTSYDVLECEVSLEVACLFYKFCQHWTVQWTVNACECMYD